MPISTDTPIALHECLPLRTPDGRYLFSVPTTAFVALDGLTSAIVDALAPGATATLENLVERLAPRFSEAAVTQGIQDLLHLEILTSVNGESRTPSISPATGTRFSRAHEDFDARQTPLTSLTAHIAHDCNLRCTYCYADTGPYGGERGQMTCTMARRYVDLLLERSLDAPQVTLIFFGGEPLLNYPTLVDAMRYGRARAAECGKRMRFAITTNGTLLDQEKFAALVDDEVSITVSMDGPPNAHDAFRIFADGQGTYEALVQRLKPLLPLAPVTCRVTLTRRVTDVPALVDHCLGLGFREVTIGSVGSPDPLMAIPPEQLPGLLDGFRECAGRYVAALAEGQYYGFGNLTNMLRLIHGGNARSFGCGAGIQTVAGDPGGQLYMCHRTVGDPAFQVGDAESGFDEVRRAERLDQVHVKHKPLCQSCWARTLCAGSCFHQLNAQWGDVTRTYDPLCDWLRGWLTTCLEAYALIQTRHPAFITEMIEPRLA